MHSWRRGFTLLELLVALAVSGVALLLMATGAVQQQRAIGAQMDLLSGRGELRVTTAGIPAELRALDPTLGDIADARDTALQLRGTIGAAVVCDTAKQRVVLAAASTGAPAFASYLRTPVATDTLWTLDTARVWTAHVITSVQTVAPGSCRLGGPLAAPGATGVSRMSLGIGDAAIPPPGTATRITRPIRYSLYKSSDRLWYLGARDWNSTTHQLNTIQPVSGPFLAPAAHGLTFTYLDSTGATLPAPVLAVQRIAAVRVTLISARHFEFGAAPGAAASDTASVLVRLMGSGR